MKIAIIIGSTRPTRVGGSVGEWVYRVARDRIAAGKTEARYELVDIKDFNLELLDDPQVPGAANRQYVSPTTQAWSKKIDEFDGFVFVTAEYNHSVPAAFKNAVDLLAPEWADKAVGFVSYGADSGIRAVEHWRTIVANLRMLDVRAQVPLSLFTEFGPDGVNPNERRERELNTMFDQLEDATGMLIARRAQQ
jgi:NAD(P)H-dependent FMN reductase